MPIKLRQILFKYCCPIFLTGFAYFIAAEISFFLSLPPSYAAAVWPSAGIALAAVLLWGRRVWLGILLARLAMNLLSPIQVGHVLPWLELIAFLLIDPMGAILQAWLGARLIKPIIQASGAFAKSQDVFKFLFLGGPISCLLAPTWGMGTVLLFGIVPLEGSAYGWFTWWLGDTIGVLIVTPLLLIFSGKAKDGWFRRGLPISLSLAGTFILIVFSYNYTITWEQENLRQSLVKNTMALHNSLFLWKSWVVLLVGLVMTSVISAFLLSLAGRTAQVEAEVAQRTQELKASNREFETMLHIISHDLKEPLRAVHSFSTMLKEEYEKKLDDTGKDYLKRIGKSVRRMHVLLEDILKLSAARQLKVPEKKISGGEVVEVVLERLASAVEDTGAKLKVAKGFPLLQADKTWAVQALYNLVHNALKFSFNGHSPEVEIKGYWEEQENGLRTGFVVYDRGPGIASAYRERIFELFQRAVGHEIEGSGAGLAIVWEVAERHGGRVWVEARQGGGSEFYLTFGRIS